MGGDPKVEEILTVARKLNEDEFRGTLTSGNSLNDVLEELNFSLEKHLADKERKRKITEHIVNISAGDFSTVLPISDEDDELDVISMGLNTFVEELRDNSISIKAFDDVFNSFKSPFFIVNINDKVITKFNKSALDFFNYKQSNKYQIPISEILDKDLVKVIDGLDFNKSKATTIQKTLNTRDGKLIISFSKLDSTYNPVSSVAVLITDVTDEFKKQKETENLIFRTIVDTQEKERIRFAKDIHDSLGQQLSGISFHLASLSSGSSISSNVAERILSKSRKALKEVLDEVRNICFNLMPRSLENLSLAEALNELCRNIRLSGELEFHISFNKKFPSLHKSLEIAIFRIVQEFINNSIKHGKAKNIRIIFTSDAKTIKMVIKDNGKGFDYKKTLANSGLGMGLKNVRSRVKSFNGDIEIKSSAPKGTSYEIAIPILKGHNGINVA